MKLFRTVLALAVVAGFALCALEVAAQQKGKGKGTVGKVKSFTDNKLIVTVKTKDASEDKTFDVDAQTKIQKGAKKGEKPATVAATELKEGTFVRVTTREGEATKAATVTILAGFGKKKDSN